MKTCARKIENDIGETPVVVRLDEESVKNLVERIVTHLTPSLVLAARIGAVDTFRTCEGAGVIIGRAVQEAELAIGKLKEQI